MTTIDFPNVSSAERPRFKLSFGIKRWLVTWRQQRRAARRRVALAQLDERLLHDIALEPWELYQVLRQRAPQSMLSDSMRRRLDAGGKVR